MKNLFNSFTQYLEHAVFLSNYCPSNPLGTTICNPFWLTIVLLPIFIAISILLFILYKQIRKEALIRYYQKQKELEQQIADKEVLDRYKWRGMDSDLDDLAQDELAEKLRQSIKS